MNILSILLICIQITLSLSIKSSIDWTPVDKVLDQAIANGTFPGCTVIIADDTGVLYEVAKGNFTYGSPPPLNGGMNPAVEMDTLFDMASCSKVTGATSAVAQFYQRGELDLHTKVVDILGNQFGANGKTDVTVLNCLLHNTGFPPDPTPYLFYDPNFGCPQTSNLHPAEDFSCQQQIYDAVMNQTLVNPIGSTYVYSDLSFITLMYVVGTLAQELGYVDASDLLPQCVQNPKSKAVSQCYFEAYVRIYVFEKFGMKNTNFLPMSSFWPLAAPCENDTSYLHRVIQGQVSDGNAYAMGGIAGHAGIFSNAQDMLILMNRILFAQPNDPIINKTTADFFIKEYNHSQSSRALGWNTNDPTVFDEGWGLLCGDMSATTFTHVGFTGTQVCGDPERNLITIFLTNRVYPSAENFQIENARRMFNSQVVKLYDAYKNGQ